MRLVILCPRLPLPGPYECMLTPLCAIPFDAFMKLSLWHATPLINGLYKEKVNYLRAAQRQVWPSQF